MCKNFLFFDFSGINFCLLMIDLWFEFVIFNGLLGFIVIFLYLFLILCVRNVWLKWGIFLRIF